MMNNVVNGTKLKLVHATDAEFDKFFSLGRYCFGLTDEWKEYIRGSYKRGKVFLTENEDGEYTSSLIILPFNMFINGKLEKLGGISYVTTMPEYRHGGTVSMLLDEALKYMNENGIVYSTLFPFDDGFYRKAGWELAYQFKAYHLPIDLFKKFSGNNGIFHPVKEENIPELKEFYKNYLVNFNGPIFYKDYRYKLNFIDQDRNKKYRYGLYEDGKMAGFILYSIKNRKMTVEQMLYNNLDSRLKLLSFIYRHSAQADKVKLITSENDDTLFLLDSVSHKTNLHFGPMARVINVKQALMNHSYDSKTNYEFTISVADKRAPWNNGTLNVSIVNGVPNIEKKDGINADLSTDIQTFTKLIWGATTPLKEAVIGKLTSKIDLAELDIIFPKKDVLSLLHF